MQKQTDSSKWRLLSHAAKLMNIAEYVSSISVILKEYRYVWLNDKTNVFTKTIYFDCSNFVENFSALDG